MQFAEEALSADQSLRVARRDLLLAAGAGLVTAFPDMAEAAAAAPEAAPLDPRLFEELCAAADAASDPWLRVAALRELTWQAQENADPMALNNSVAQYERARAEAELAKEASNNPLRRTLETLGLEAVRSSMPDPHMRRRFPPHEQDVTPALQIQPFGAPVAVVIHLEGGLDPAQAPPGGKWIEATLLRDRVPVACARVRNITVLASAQAPGRWEYRVRIRNLSATPLWVNLCPFQSKPIVQAGTCPA